ncbi:hypothetical protein BFX40_10235 [Mesorhizobium sp. SEMIA 3007]|nr:hypothetical protein BFX40_10235 [Mesorhizobium sp. SEMIA 3007]
MSTREITGHLHDLYGIDVSPDLISTVTDAILDEVATWQQRPLDPVYSLIFFDAIRVKIGEEGMVLNKAIPIAPSVRAEGAKEVLGLWLEQNEGAKFWLRVMNELIAEWTRSAFVVGPSRSGRRPQVPARACGNSGRQSHPKTLKLDLKQNPIQTSTRPRMTRKWPPSSRNVGRNEIGYAG